jgi:hypothetical protein
MGALSAWIYLRYTVAVYRSEATIQIDPKRASASALTDKNSDYAAALDIISEKYIELFNDIQVLEEVVKQGDYHIDFYSVGRLGQFLIYPLPVGLEVASERDRGKSKNFSILIENVDDSTYRILRNSEVVKVCKWDGWTEWEGVSFRLHLRRPLAPGKYLLNYHSVQAAATYWGERIRVVPKRGFTVLSVMVMDISPTRAQAFCQSLLQSVRHH